MPLLVLVIGGSGAGKTLLTRSLKEHYANLHANIIPGTTSRPRRDGEEDDEYRFVSPKYCEHAIEGKDGVWRKQFLYDTWYLTRAHEIEEGFRDSNLAFLILAQEALEKVIPRCHKQGIDTLQLFLKSPNSVDELAHRLRKRCEDPESIQARIRADVEREKECLDSKFPIHVIQSTTPKETLGTSIQLIDQALQHQ